MNSQMSRINVWKYIKVDPESVKNNPYLQPDKEEPITPAATISSINRKYLLLPRTTTYALGVQQLRDECAKDPNPNHPTYTLSDGSKVIRPLTFKENLEARVNEYNTLKNADGSNRTKEERLRLFNTCLDSCCGTAYQRGSTKFKIILQCSELISIDSAFNQSFLPIDYSQIKNGIELDSANGIYSVATNKVLLTRTQVLEHQGWLVLAEGDKSLLSNSYDIALAEYYLTN